MTNFNDLLTVWKYPGGEVGVRAIGCALDVFRVQNSDDFMALLMYLNCEKERGYTVEQITIPYLPYSRQDRVAVSGDPFAIKVVAQLLATTDLRKVYTYDVHSGVAASVFAKVGIELCSISPIIPMSQFINGLGEEAVILVSPDKGAIEKTEKYYNKLAVDWGMPEVRGIVQCDKVRDPDTGKISGFRTVHGPKTLPNSACFVILDDICDGGGTFIGVAKALTKTYGDRNMYLYTTHGIYSKGIDVLADIFEKIGSTNSFLHGQEHPALFTYSLF